MADERPSEADDLYALEPAAFIEARNALVRELKAQGRKEDAAAVSGLRRPTPTAWALNLVAREQPDLVERALDAGHRLRDATEAAVGGKADDLRAATTDDQAASGAVVEAAVKQLGARGPGLTPIVRATVRAAVLSEDVADELRRGVLATEHEAGGFEFGEGFALAAGVGRSASRAPAAKGAASPAGSAKGSSRKAGDEVAARRRARDEERAAQKAEKERRAELQAKVRALRDEAAELEREAKAQERSARTARSAADKAARALDAAQRELDDA